MQFVPKIIVHGGAWAIPDKLADRSRAGVRIAAQLGLKKLQETDSALDAVEAAVRSLEDDPVFDAGKGSALNVEGGVEMDAIIMDGKNLAAGAVAGVDCVQNPVSLARLVMEKTDHVLLMGKGARLFAEEMKIPLVGKKYLVTEEALEEFVTYTKYKAAVVNLFNNKISGCDTVGAVAIDSHGNIACATSTGGITAKRVGRVGDAPIVGAGAYCDNLAGGVSCTGHGESIMRVCLAHHIVQLQRTGMSASEAARSGLAYMSERVKGAGGVICISNRGEVGFHFTTEKMAWAHASENLVTFGLDPGESVVQNI